MIFLGGEIRVADGYVLVCNESVPDRRRAREILANVDLALERSGLRSVLFDTRDMPAPPEEVNQILRHWTDGCHFHDKVALLVKSDLKLVASNMRALSAKVKMRSFHELEEAEAWLRVPIAGGIKPKPKRSLAVAGANRRRDDDAPKPRAHDDTRPRFEWKSPLLRRALDRDS